jgi:hypothetical protein
MAGREGFEPSAPSAEEAKEADTHISLAICPPPAKPRMLDLCGFLNVLRGFIWFLGLEIRFAAQIHINPK